MFKELYEYGIKNGFEEDVSIEKDEHIKGFIRIDNNGNYQGVEPTEKGSLVKTPNAPNWSGTAAHAIPFVNKISRILPSDELGHSVWIKQMNDACEHIDGTSSLKTFLDDLEENKVLQEELIRDLKEYGLIDAKGNNKLSFKVDGEYILDAINWQLYFQNLIKRDSCKEEISLFSTVTGKEFNTKPGKLEKFGSLKDDDKANVNLGKGVSIGSFKYKAFENYGFDGSESMAASQEEMNVITNVLQYLVSSSNHSNPNFNLVHWYSEEQEDLIKESLDLDELSFDELMNIAKEDSKSTLLKELLEAALKGNKISEQSDANYYTFNFEVPEDGRTLSYNFQQHSYNELVQGLYNWYKDSTLTYGVYDKNSNQYITVEKPIFNVYSIILTLLENKNEKDAVTKEFGRNKKEILDTIYHNKKVPKLFSRKTVIAGLKTSEDANGHKTININPTITKLLKVYINRERGVEMIQKDLNKDNESTCYQLGRFFAVCEKLQKDANGSNNLVSYYSSLTKRPEFFYRRLDELSKQYVKQLKNSENVGIGIHLEKLLTEIQGKITDIPTRMKNMEAAEYILGYSQQKIDLYTSHKEDGKKEGE